MKNHLVLKSQRLIATFTLLSAFSLISLSQTSIHFFGVNGWYPTYFTGGNLTGIFGTGKISNSSSGLGARMLRIGGTKYDQVNVSAANVGALVSTAQNSSNNMDVIVQIPGLAYWLADYWNNYNASASMMTALTDPVNGILVKTGTGTFYDQCQTYVTTLKNSVNFWSIGNEPDNYSTHNGVFTTPNTSFYDLKNPSDAPVIATYIKTIANWVRGWDPGCTIFGPEFAYHRFNMTSQGTGLFEKLSDVTIPAQDIWTSSATYPGNIDVFSFHYYPYHPSIGWSKADLISAPFLLPTWSLNDVLTGMQTWLTSNGSYPYAKLGITEFNVSYENQPGSNGINDENANSFIAGQFFAELLAVGRYHQQYSYNVSYMMPWSIQEGATNQGSTDLGILDHPSTGVYDKRSTYHHFNMMAKSFEFGRVQFWPVSTNNIKAFAVRSCTGAAVMVMNQNSGVSTNYSYRFNLDGVSVTTGETIHGNVNMEWDGRFVSSTMANGIGNIGDLETHLFILDACGNVIKTYQYDATINASGYGDPVPGGPYGPNAGCGCNIVDETGEWYHQGESPYRPAPTYVTGISNESSNLNVISIYPNPAENEITFAGELKDSEDANLLIYSSTGKLLNSYLIDDKNFKLAVDLTPYQNGLYFYSISTESGKSAAKKFVINR